MDMPGNQLLAGVIEGFYGPPWSQAERFELFEWMATWGLNTYVYAPKDDLKHRTLWRESYSSAEAEALAALVRACKARRLRFVFALSPGLDVSYSSEDDLGCLRRRFEQMFSAGCENFALLFDDIPERLQAEDSARWGGSFASAQCHLANTIFGWARESGARGRFLFCPTPYCGRMAKRGFGGKDYLHVLGRGLLPEIDVFWTGPEIISQEITAAEARELQRALRRKPLLWDNLHANDYDGRRFYCGPYAGRPLELRGEVSGFLANPNNEFPLNYVPLGTLAQFVRSDGNWDARKAYVSAMGEWLPRFQTVGPPLQLEDLILFGDCYYLPHKEGPEAQALFECARNLVNGNPLTLGEQLAMFRNRATRLRTFCARLAELRERPLFHALSRRVWELREELDLLTAYVEFRAPKAGGPHLVGNGAFRSDFHLPGTYRGGLLARFQRLLEQQADGTFIPAHTGGSNS